MLSVFWILKFVSHSSKACLPVAPNIANMITHLSHFAIFLSLVAVGTSSPLANEPRSTSLPILKLPYASYRASSYNADDDM